jgi:hypothetical protein
MIFNLKQYLFNETGMKIYANPKDLDNNETPPALVQLIEEGGSSTAWFKFNRYNVQVIVRDIDSPKARLKAYIIYNLLDNHFGLELPEVVVDGITYSAMKFAQISADSEPGFIKYDENGRAEYSSVYRFLI